MAENSPRSLVMRESFVAVMLMVTLCGVGFAWLWTKAGGATPGGSGYEVSFVAPDVKNLQNNGDVRMAGVLIGEVSTIEASDEGAKVTVELTSEAVPLHDGATVRVGVKSMVGQSYLEVVDGSGDEITSGSTLPTDAVLEATDIDELISTFDAPTRKALSGVLTHLGRGTAGTSESVSDVLSGLGDAGREGSVAMDALAQEDRQLRALIDDTAVILEALDANTGQFARMVEQTQLLTNVTSAQRADIETTVRALPALLDSATTAAGSLEGLSTDLAPVATDLRAAAPDLSAALEELPATTRDLRALLPDLDDALDRAPATLDRTSQFAADLGPLSDETYAVLADVNPMLEYIRPYWLDIGSFFGNFGASFDTPVENGIQPVHLAGIYNMYSVRGVPIDVPQMQPVLYDNAYPPPGSAHGRGPFEGPYPRIERDD